MKLRQLVENFISGWVFNVSSLLVLKQQLCKKDSYMYDIVLKVWG